MKKKNILLIVLFLLFFICVIPIRHVLGYQTHGISLPWFSIPNAFSSHDTYVDALIWNYSDSYISGSVVINENTGISSEQLMFARSIKLFNCITVWKSERLCIYDNGKLIDLCNYDNGSIVENNNLPSIELKANELVFEKNSGKKSITVEAIPLYGAKIKSARLLNSQTGEEIQMHSISDDSFEAITVVNTDIAFDQNRLAKDIVLKVYAVLEENEYEAEIKIRISAKENYMMNYVECHYYSYINSSSFISDSNEERKDKIDKLMCSLKEQGFLEYYEINDEFGTLSYEVMGSGISKQVHYTDNK